MARIIKADGRVVRLLCVLITRPNEKRDLREAQLCMSIDNKLRNLNEPYDGIVEKLNDRVNALRATYRVDSPEFIQEMTLVNREVNEADKVAEAHTIEVTLEDREYEHLETMIRELKNVPTDRTNGPLYLRMQTAIDKAEKITIDKALKDA